MTQQQMKEKRASILAAAQNLIPKSGGMTQDANVKFEGLMGEAEELRLRIERETASPEHRANPRPSRSQPGAGIETNNERAAEKLAFAAYMRDGILDRSILREQRSLDTTSGGVLIAQDYNPVLDEAKKAWGELAYAVAQKPTRTGEPMRVAGVDDTTQMSTVLGENNTVAEADPTFAGIISNVDFLTTGEIKVSLAEIQDSFFDLDAFIRNAFGKRIARGLASLIVAGSTNFQSIITAPSHSTVTTATGDIAAPKYSDFVAMYAALDPAYIPTASWVMNSSTRAAILNETDTLGRPLFVPNVNTDNLGTILGLPVVISQSHPNTGANSVGAVQLSSLKDAYTLRTAGEVSILRLNERYADQGQVAFIGYHRAGGYASPVGKATVNLVQAAS